METPVWGWASKNTEVTMQTSWDNKTYAVRTDKTGKWMLKISTPSYGGPYEIEVSSKNEQVKIKNVMIGEVWLCSGQSNMEMPLKGFPGQPVLGGNEEIVHSTNKNIRLITIPRDSKVVDNQDFQGEWKEASPAATANFSATAWYFGSLVQEVINQPVGLIHVSYGGSNVEAWMSAEMLKDFDSISIPKTEKDIGDPNRTATALFNGMLSPAIGYGIKGAIWYQGESNYDRPFQYKFLFEKMVREWRKLWGQGEFPFYFTQIAPFDYSVFKTGEKPIDKYNSAYIRESQLKASKEITNSGMAVLMDVGEKDNIHPQDKEKGGQRLAFLALAKTYGINGFEYQSPEFKGMETKGSTLIISFDNVPNGITSYGKEVSGFEIAGADKVFYPATVVLRRKSVMISSPQVQNPVAVRYLFTDFARAQIFSTGGLPLSSFRTDNW
ncbi:9-O-acetylesterase [Neptunitalea sp. Y10]|uniref:9-O-acetylesterase n=2 Tax=Neptunitalea lumnitzerae TaxID=2965509 RepID=A0ABQ5MJP4_9FLAO|nr:9-O-acetylesterase [Neptunitalea sp. Y10]